MVFSRRHSRPRQAGGEAKPSFQPNDRDRLVTQSIPGENVNRVFARNARARPQAAQGERSEPVPVNVTLSKNALYIIDTIIYKY